MFKPTNFSAHGNRQKKRSLNLVNAAEAIYRETKGNKKIARKTIELRLPEGTLNGEDIKAWVRIIVLFVDNMAKAKMPENIAPVESLAEFFQIIGLEKKDCFLFLSKGLYETKIWACNRINKSDWAGANPKGAKACKEAREKLALLL
jgi:hypothetical protein